MRQFFLVALLFLMPIFVSALPSSDEAKQLIQTVNGAFDASKTGPYVLTSLVVFNPGTKQELKGNLTFYRDVDHQRTDLQLGSYRDIRIRQD